MKVLVISPQPVFQPRGTPLSVYYRTLVTAELDADIDLLTYGEGADIDIRRVRIVRIPRFRVLGNVKVGPSMLKLFLDVWLFFKTVGLLLTRKYDFVHAHEEAVFFCVLLKPLFRFRYVYDMHSSLPQQLKSFEFTRSKLIIWIFEALEKKALRSADAVITICQDLYDYAEPILQGRCPHVMIENSLLDPVQLITPRDESKEERVAIPLPGDHRLVVYAGTLEPYQGIELLLEAFAALATRLDDVSLVIAGGKPAQIDHYRAMAQDLDINARCHFTGSISRAAAMHLNGQASVLVSPRTVGGNTPLKVYEQLASGIPLVATDIHSHTQALNEDVAFLVRPDADSFSDGLLRALTSQDQARKKVKNALALYAEKYSRETYVGKMKIILEAVDGCVA
ncbi:MAG: glycosyltransferase family 4 protein [Rhodothermales bacterium]|nr:glycosyltransferase family 4 protein [Rhodothermales bacterium]